MKCPICAHNETKVNDSRVSSDANNIKRRRECTNCGFRFSTVEEIAILDLVVVKRDGKREPYDRDKIERGLKKALEKRPYTTEDFKMLLSSIVVEIQKKRKNEITSLEIGDIVSIKLETFDNVAFIRFASVYKQFQDVANFVDALSQLKKRRKANQ